MTTVLPQTKMAGFKGGTLTLGSKGPLITAADSVPPASQATIILKVKTENQHLQQSLNYQWLNQWMS
jgi:hypothetical protein